MSLPGPDRKHPSKQHRPSLRSSWEKAVRAAEPKWPKDRHIAEILSAARHKARNKDNDSNDDKDDSGRGRGKGSNNDTDGNSNSNSNSNTDEKTATTKDPRLSTLPALATTPAQAYDLPARAMQAYVNATDGTKGTARANDAHHGLQIFNGLYVLHQLFRSDPAMVCADAEMYFGWVEGEMEMRRGEQVGNKVGDHGFRGVVLLYTDYLFARMQLEIAENLTNEPEEEQMARFLHCLEGKYHLRSAQDTEGKELCWSPGLGAALFRDLALAKMRPLVEGLKWEMASRSPQRCMGMVLETLQAETNEFHDG